ncbi:hypothetical protein Moror_10603 [Moniliophthora roreri MCA 2997]|uniref:WD40 repeat-like protein n=1 Tax=Moniliophthora roreri (strain MCA 2997) TaxID=1381753 RepID=V2YJA2_MONRO|nr:hypothetical protein Moror_10603 [Moniliophthora roreri MCA 2997]
MLAVVTTDSISVVEPRALKLSPSSVSSSCQLESPAISACWSTDNSLLYLASQKSISKYQQSSNSSEIHCSSDNISHLVVKDKSTIVFSTENTIHFLESMSTSPKLSPQSYNSHKSAINSLSLSCDNTLLLSTSSSAAHIHNLSLNNSNPTTILRGLPPSPIRTAVFHPHVRTRALVGAGKQLLLYDTTRPSSPLKTFTVSTTEGNGEVEVIACSTFSKTLVAVVLGGVSAGTIGLVDLDKEKGLFRTINTKVPISTLSFSPEGASIYAGTETGKLLVLKLRTLDEPPPSVDIEGSNGARIVSICVQKKAKTESAQPSPARKASTYTSNSPATRRVVSIFKPTTPARGTRVVSSVRPATTAKLASGTTNVDAKKSTLASGKVFSPIRSPLANSSNRKVDPDASSTAGGEDEFSVKLETLGTLRRAGGPTSPSLSQKIKEKTSALTVGTRPTPRQRTVSGTSSISKVSGSVATTTSPKPSTNSLRSTISTVTAPTTRSRVMGELASAARPSSTRTTSSRSRTRTGEGKTSSVPPVPPLPKDIDSDMTNRNAKPGTRSSSNITDTRPHERERTRTRTQSSRDTKTPSPDLPDIDHEIGLVTPGPAVRGVNKGLAMRALGLGTPRISPDKGKGKAKSVGFFEDEAEGEQLVAESDDEENVKDRGDDERIELAAADESANDFSMQISPARRRGPQTTNASSEYNHNIFNAFPMSPPRPAGINGQSSHPQSPQNLLRTIVHSVLSDFHLQTHKEMTNLHLDLVRMGRGWRRDVREVVREEMEGVLDGMMKEMREDMIREIRENSAEVGGPWTGRNGGSLQELREENRRLREENERLRRAVVGQAQL